MPRITRNVIPFFLIIASAWFMSCSDITPFIETPNHNSPGGRGVRQGTPTVTNAKNVFTFSTTSSQLTKEYQDTLHFDTSAVSYSIVVSEYKGGSLVVVLMDSVGNVLLTNNISSDTVLTNSYFTVGLPKRFVISLTGFTGNILVEITQKDFGMPPDIFGLWNWEKSCGGFTGGCERPDDVHHHILLMFAHDNTYSIYLADTLLCHGIYSIEIYPDYLYLTLHNLDFHLGVPFGAGSSLMEFTAPDTLMLFNGLHDYFSRIKY